MIKAMRVFLILALLSLQKPVVTLGAEVDPPQPPAKIYKVVPDLLLYRPLLVFGSLAPTAGFLATLPITRITNKDLKASEYLVHRPWTYSADRPLGFFPPQNIPARIDEGISLQYQDYFVRVGGNRPPDQR
jgi:hypothetical protein